MAGEGFDNPRRHATKEHRSPPGAHPEPAKGRLAEELVAHVTTSGHLSLADRTVAEELVAHVTTSGHLSLADRIIAEGLIRLDVPELDRAEFARG